VVFPDRANPLQRWLAVAEARTAADRAWQLVGLATTLRQLGESGLALHFLDAAVALRPGPAAEGAAYACAVRVHWDAGDFETARKVEQSSPAF
jgi:hypothetical protein